MLRLLLIALLVTTVAAQGNTKPKKESKGNAKGHINKKEPHSEATVVTTPTTPTNIPEIRSTDGASTTARFGASSTAKATTGNADPVTMVTNTTAATAQATETETTESDSSTKGYTVTSIGVSSTPSYAASPNVTKTPGAVGANNTAEQVLVASITDPTHFNDFDKADIMLYRECNDLSIFKPEMMGWWIGRTQISEEAYHKEFDIHNILADGSGVINGRSDKDVNKIARQTPTKMWCKTYPNGFDKTVKVQYGPTIYGQIICVDLEIDDNRPDEMMVGVNQALFTDARVPLAQPVALDCVNYPHQSKYNAYTIWTDNLSRISYVKWDRTQPTKKGSDWELGDE